MTRVCRTTAGACIYLSRQPAIGATRSGQPTSPPAARERVLPGIAVSDFAISPDEREVAYTVRPAGGGSQVWLAALDRRSAPHRVIDGRDSVSFGPGETLIVRALGERSNTLVRVRKDGSGRERIGSYVIIDKGQASPAARGSSLALCQTAQRRTRGRHGDSGCRRGSDSDLQARLRGELVTRRTVLRITDAGDLERGRGWRQQVRVHGCWPDAGDPGSAGPCRSGVANHRQRVRSRLDGLCQARG